MKFATVFLGPILAWTAAAAIVQLGGRDTATNLISSRGTTRSAMVAELIKANKQGVPKFTLPAAPTKGKKVLKRSLSLETVVDEPGLYKRAHNEPELNEVVTGTAADTVGITGLGPCIGIITTFSKVSAGKVNKVAAHLGAAGGPAALTTMVRAIYSAAAEGGVWEQDLDAGHRPQIHVSYPDAEAEVAAMVKEGEITQAQSASMKATLQSVISQVTTDLESLCTSLDGHCYSQTRVGAKTVGSSMQATAAGAVTIDGVSM
ncbi:hypothetical protein N0V93_006368 [Gnomoniopsis smithogilvyi]|uniref:Uncharacterized protein n=1 Tax=Gnomoniopsis smithogilvyi TaxID=1191159 RepID=A0A9W8YPK0_9PEZI|nr:hypothetical protein N0V93_006368 [Gnomoniopsis smithogilvyi]